MGSSRSAFSWPGPLEAGLASNKGVFGTEVNMMAGTGASMTPPSESRPLTSSPPQGPWTPAQLELRRQRERARRDMKLSARIQRASSTPYALASPSMALGDGPGAINVANYTTAASQSVPMLGTTTMSTPAFLPPYSSALPDQGSGNQVFTPSYHHSSLPPHYGVSMDYAPGYGGPSDYSARSPPVALSQDRELLYQLPTVGGSSNTGGHDTGAGAGAGSGSSSSSHVRVVQARPKPRCWEHGCNGRQFSTFSNLLRHQREKSGQAAKAMCPNCGAEFTRTTARNGHLLHDKCKQRRSN